MPTRVRMLAPAMNATQERRQFGRRKLRQIAWIIVPGRSRLACTILNLSPNGAFLELDPPKWLPFRFALKIDGSPSARVCELRHASPLGLGVIFSEPAPTTDTMRVAGNLVRERDDWMGPRRR